MSKSRILRERVAEHRARQGAEIFQKPHFEEGDVVISAWMLEEWKNFSEKRLLKTEYLQMVVKVHPGWTESDGRVTNWKLDSRWFRKRGLGEIHKGGPAEGYVKVTEAISPETLRVIKLSEKFKL